MPPKGSKKIKLPEPEPRLQRNAPKGIEMEAKCKEDNEDELDEYDDDEDVEEEDNDSFIARSESSLSEEGDRDHDAMDKCVFVQRRKNRVIHESDEDEVSVKNETTASKQREKRKAQVMDEKLPGHSTYPIFSYSVTISKVNGDVPKEFMPILQSYLDDHCEQGKLTLLL